ncbi:hypothetical protein FRC02_004921, partial [Tulasnella sp. 418]
TYDLQTVHQGLTSNPPTIYFKKLTESELEEKCQLLATLKEQGNAESKKQDHNDDSESDDGESSDSADSSSEGSTDTEVVKGTRPPKSKRRWHHCSASTIDDTDNDGES